VTTTESDAAALFAQQARAREAEIFARENDRVKARREKLAVTGTATDAQRPRGDENLVGLALSGGGIRSATFSLGLLSALGAAKSGSNKSLLAYVDYLSTVSGGGYTGSFLCSCYVPGNWRGDIEQPAASPAPVDGTEDPFAGDAGRQRIEHLRQSGRYLLPSGTGDAVRLMVIVSRSWFAIHSVIGLSIVAIIMAFKLLQAVYLNCDLALDFEATLADQYGMPQALWPSQWMQGYVLGHWLIASWLWLIAAPFLLVTTGLFWSYFLTRTTPHARSRAARVLLGPSGFVGLVAGGAGLLLIGWPEEVGIGLLSPVAMGWALVLLSAIALGSYAAAEICDAFETRRQLRMGGRKNGRRIGPDSPRVQEDRVRVRLTDWATFTLKWGLFVAALALFDTVAQTLFVLQDEIRGAAATWIAALVSIPVLRQILLRLPQEGGAGKTLFVVIARFGMSIALVVGLVLMTVIGIFWALVAQGLAWRNGVIGGIQIIGQQSPLRVLAATVVALCVAFVAIAFSFGFLNLSTYANFYAMRLRRAYLGASNERRWMFTGPDQTHVTRFPINQDHIDDDIALDRYYDPEVMAPLHLINVTINDTSSRSANTVQHDRRGKPLVISSAGFLFPASEGPRLHAQPFDGTTKANRPDRLPLSAWIGISGAAASTGMGQFGSLGTSLLAGIANVRLGIWWNAGKAQDKGMTHFVQARLAAEFLGRFPGTDGARWYLTDGGHFENSGAYELVRRRLRLIILSDNGADPKYQFADVVNLARRIRIDFNAELTFAGEQTLDQLLGTSQDDRLRHAFGTLKELSGIGQADKRIGPYAALGQIRYLDDPDPEATAGTLLLIKPRVCGCEAQDLVAYARANPLFPQQSTLDQFFDEPQWESYFRLGQRIGETLYHADVGSAWSPHSMMPVSSWPSADQVSE
jgi:hypothetical protein